MRFIVRKHLSNYIVLGLLVISQWTFAQDFEKVQIETFKVTESVFMLKGSGGNIGVSVGEDGVLLIDSEFPQMVEKIKAAVAKLNGGPIRFVLNTNWHFDHADGNELLAKAGAIVIAHDNSRMHMLSEQTIPEYNPDLRIPPYPKAALPVITVADSLTLHFNGDEIQAIHIPNAHSDSDLAFYFRKANVIHTGDLYFSNGFPFINISSGGSIAGMIAAAEKILNKSDANTKVIPGHGSLSDREEVQAYRDILVTARDRIAKLIKEGKTLDEVLAAEPTAALYKGGKSFISPELFVKVVYMDLAKQ
ncbi:MAG: MBL fold metallo-hydrolase [Desulfobacterales bacterium]|nr:MBL fold metallo-hydrolase [Desulfobacterales bacterium]